MKQTAVDWFASKVMYLNISPEEMHDFLQWFEEAKQMEKEQIMKTARQCHFEGVRQSAKTTLEYIIYAQLYYNETYGEDE